MTNTAPPCDLAPATRLRLNSAPFGGASVTLREHWCGERNGRGDQALVALTLHPGFMGGSYAGRDYFERLAPYLRQQAAGRYRLQIFTLNHPGYDLPRGGALDPLRLEAYGIAQQPAALRAGLAWLLNSYLAHEAQIHLVCYGHSMGGLALSRVDLAELAAEVGPRLRTTTKILSAPALALNPLARAGVWRLDALETLKLTLGRLPLYQPTAVALYQALAPLFFRRDGPTFTLDADDDFYNFKQLDPFLLLQQGRELLRFDARAAGGARLLAGAHLLLATGDRMLDLEATLTLAEEAAGQGLLAGLHGLESGHVAERETPARVAAVVEEILADSGLAIKNPRRRGRLGR